jgi:hypothetical protein
VGGLPTGSTQCLVDAAASTGRNRTYCALAFPHLAIVFVRQRNDLTRQRVERGRGLASGRECIGYEHLDSRTLADVAGDGAD